MILEADNTSVEVAQMPRWSRYGIWGILAIALALRFYAIDQPLIDAFSWRQASTAMMAENFYRTNPNILFPEVNWNGPGPSYQGREFQTVTYLAALLYNLLGQHDWIGRSIAVAFGVWGVFALYQLVRYVWDEPRALTTAAVMAVLPGSVFIERSFLPDPAMVALVTTGAWLLLRYLQSDRLLDLGLATLITSLGFLTKLPGLIIGLPMLYAILLTLHHQKWPLQRIWKISFASVCVLTCVIAYYLWARHLSLSYPPYHFAGGGNWVWDRGLRSYLQETYYLPMLFERLQGWLWTPPILVLVCCGIFLPFSPRQKFEYKNELDTQRYTKPIWFFHGWVLAILVFYAIGAKEIVHNPWNLHLINPAAAALTGHAVVTFTGVARNRLMYWNLGMLWRFSLIIPLVCYLAIGYYGRTRLPYLYYPYAAQSYQLGHGLQQVSDPKDLVVTMADFLGDPIAIYYSHRRGWVFPPPWDGISWGEQSIQDDMAAIQWLETLQQQEAQWFGIVGDRIAELQQNNPTFMAYLKQHSNQVQRTSDFVIYQLYPLNSP